MKKRNTFQLGNKAACGKHAPGSGRPPDWLKAMCQEIVKDKKLVEFLGDVASGVPVRMALAVGDEKPIEGVKVPADIKDRIRATEMLLDRGFGKPVSVLDLGDGSVAFSGVMVVPSKELGGRGAVKES